MCELLYKSICGVKKETLNSRVVQSNSNGNEI